MLFNSYEFIFLFLPVTLVIYFLISKWNIKASVIWLFFASFCFYAYWKKRYAPLLLASILWNFCIGKGIEKSEFHKKLLLVIGLTVNFALLAYFKYTNFFIDTLNHFTPPHLHKSPLEIILPLGISFWTFTQTAYLIDTYRGKTIHYTFWDYGLFVTIFPHLIAGPIIDHKEIIPQCNAKETHQVNWNNVCLGIMIFVVGLFKKVIIADAIAPWADGVFSGTGALPLSEAWLGVLAYTYQIYFDFSGYSEMAIGLGKMLNIDFPTNFDAPYQSASVIEFWRRWHMTLGGWIKNYLYIPLGGNQKGHARKMLNLFICMTLCGFWHGAGWMFVLWGALHGLYLVINHSWRKTHIQLPYVLCRVLTFACVVFGWILFRAETTSTAKRVLAGLVNIQQVLPSGTSTFSLATSGIIMGLLTVITALVPSAQQLIQRKAKINGISLVGAIVLTFIAILSFSKESVFIYFNF